jgi:hypothetical protein
MLRNNIYGRVLFGYKPFWFISEKLRTIKTARFYGRGFFCMPLPFGEGASEKLLNDKIFIFWRSGVIWI